VEPLTLAAAIAGVILELSVIGLLRRAWRARNQPSTYHKFLAVHIADTTRSAIRSQ